MKIVDIIRAIVRPFLAVTFAGGTIALAWRGDIDPGVISTFATSMAAFYFGERSARKGYEKNDS